MPYSYLTNNLILKQKISLQNCAKFFINRKLGCRKSNHLRQPSSLFSRMFTQFPMSVTVNRYLCNETTKSIDFNKYFSTCSVALSKSTTSYKNREKMKNYTFVIVLFLFSFIAFFLSSYLRRPEDVVYIEPKETKV